MISRIEKHTAAGIAGDHVAGRRAGDGHLTANGVVGRNTNEQAIEAITEQLCASDISPDKVTLDEIVVNGSIVGS